MKYLVYFNADGQPGRAFVTLQNVDAFTEKKVFILLKNRLKRNNIVKI